MLGMWVFVLIVEQLYGDDIITQYMKDVGLTGFHCKTLDDPS